MCHLGQVLAMVRSQIETMQRLRAEEIVRIARQRQQQQIERLRRRGTDVEEMSLEAVNLDVGEVPVVYPWDMSDDDAEENPLLAQRS